MDGDFQGLKNVKYDPGENRYTEHCRRKSLRSVAGEKRFTFFLLIR